MAGAKMAGHLGDSTEPAYREPPVWLRREVPGVLLIGLAALSMLAVVVPGGWVGSSWSLVLQYLFGDASVLVPVVLAAFGAALWRLRLDPSFSFPRHEAIGWIVLFFGLLGLLQSAGDSLAPYGQPISGAIGRLLRVGLVDALGERGALLTMFAICIAGLGLAVSLSPLRLLGRLWSFLLHILRLAALSVVGLVRHRVRSAPRAVAVGPARTPANPVIRRPGEEYAALAATPPRDGWELPPPTLLRSEEGGQLSPVEITKKAEQIERALAEFDVPVRVTEVNPGPTVTQFGLEPRFRERRDKRGNVVKREKVKVAEIVSLQNDLALALAASTIRVEAPVPGREFVGVEVPNSTASLVNLGRLIASTTFQKVHAKARLAVALGEDVSGRAVAADLARMPHLLIAGQTGSGKSICINSIIACLLMHTTPDELRLILVDPKRVELTTYNEVPHLLRPVLVDPEKVVSVLKWTVHEMEERYKLFEASGVRNIDGYSKLAATEPELEPLPYIVLIIDELADLMMIAADDVERLICRLAQLARATGIHLVVATQRPSVDVITGLIKANFPTRISFAVASQVDSRTILDSPGAEKLLGRGDMLYLPQEAPKSIRLQGTFVSDDEITMIVDWWKRQGPPAYVEKLVQAETFFGSEDEPDELYGQAVEVSRSFKRVSASLLQRRLRVGYARAARLIDQMEESGAIVPTDNGRSWEIVEQAATDKVGEDDGATGA